MLVAEAVLLICLATFVVAWWLRATPGQLFIIPGAVAAFIATSHGRALTEPAFMLAIIFIVMAGVAFWRRAKAPTTGKRWVSGFFVLVASAVVVLPILILPGRIVLPEPSGPYSVGVRVAVITDPDRGHAWNAADDAPRRMLVHIWHPAEPGATEPFAPWASEASRETETDAATRSLLAPLGAAKTRSRMGARAAEGAFPLILFSHGYGMQATSNTVLMEHLASRGYVAASISHPGETVGFVYPDGSVEPYAAQDAGAVDMGDGQTIAEANAAFSASGSFKTRLAFVNAFEAMPLVTQRGPVWVDDFISILDGFEGGAVDPGIDDVLASVDFSKVGFVGMSFGALTAPDACDRDERCSAAAALDVGGGPPSLRNRKARMPVLVADGASQPGRRLGGQDFYYEPHETAGRDASVTRVHFPGARHLDFTDLSLMFSPPARAILGRLQTDAAPAGYAPARDLLRAQNDIVGDFFDARLKGRDNGFPDAAIAAHDVVVKPDLGDVREWVARSR